MAFKMTEHDAQVGKNRGRGRPLQSRNSFKQRDMQRAMKSAKAEGLEISAVEVVARDGTTIRVLGKGASGGVSDLDNWIARRGKDARSA